MNTLKVSDLIIGYKQPLNSPSYLSPSYKEGAGGRSGSGFNAQLAPGKLTCLVGRNGVGKSTLLRTLAGFQSPLAGNISIGGKLTSQMDRTERARHVSVVLTGRPDLQQMRVLDIVGMGRSPYTDMWGRLSDADQKVVNDSIALVGIQHLTERNIDTLSDGECQKVMIAKALAQQTPIILLDEPTAFLDYPSKVETMKLMHDIASRDRNDGIRTSILMSTHDMEMAVSLADELWVMTSSHQLLVGPPASLADILKKENLSPLGNS